MQQKLGKTDINITKIIMGCWQAGKEHWSNIDDNNSIFAIQDAYKCGINTFDTAAEYGNGHSERIVGGALKNVRNKVIFASKVYSHKLAYNKLIKSCQESLKNLQTDYIDLFQIHWPSGSFDSETIPIAETMQALNDLKKQGKIRAIGVSNFNLTQLQEAMQYGEIASLQPPYSLFWRHVEKELLPFCIANKITVLAYSPLSQGLLTGKYTRTNKFPENDLRSKHKLCSQKLYPLVQDALDELRPIAEKNKISLTELALAWLINQPQTCAIVGAKTSVQVETNVNAMKINLSLTDLKIINAIGQKVNTHLTDDPFLWEF